MTGSSSSEYLSLSPDRLKSLKATPEKEDPNILRELFDRSIIKQLDEHDHNINTYGNPVNLEDGEDFQEDPKRSTQVVSPWIVEPPGKETNNTNKNATQSSLINIPFRNAQIVSKIISDTQLNSNENANGSQDEIAADNETEQKSP